MSDTIAQIKALLDQIDALKKENSRLEAQLHSNPIVSAIQMPLAILPTQHLAGAQIAPPAGIFPPCRREGSTCCRPIHKAAQCSIFTARRR